MLKRTSIPILKTIYQKPGVGHSDLVKSLNLGRDTVYRHIKYLKALSLIIYHQEKRFRRESYQITDKGKDLLLKEILYVPNTPDVA